MLDVPATGGLSTKTSAREVSQKRSKLVSHWFKKPAARQALRRDSLVLQLTSALEIFVSTNPKEGDPPIVVVIHQRKAHELLNELLQHLLEILHYDPDLNLAAATDTIMVVPIPNVSATFVVFKVARAA